MPKTFPELPREALTFLIFKRINRVLRVCIALLGLIGGVSAWGFTTNDANTMSTAFTSNYYMLSGINAYISTTPRSGNAEYFWGQAEEIECVIDAYEATSNNTYKVMMTNLLNGFSKNNGTNWANNMYNDDLMWACLAYIRGYQNSGNTTFLNIAKANFDMMYTRAWDTSYLGGGLWWTTDDNTKNACINGPAACTAYLLYKTLNDSSYLTKSTAIYNWERTNLFNATSGAIYDAISPAGGLGTWSSTYNQGTFIGAANFLGFTNDAILAANFTKNNMCSSTGILPQYGISGNNSGFNAIFYRWMVRFIKDRGLQSSYQQWLQDNANAAWNLRRTTDNLSWCQWLQQTPTGNIFDSWDCLSSFEAVLVMPATQSTAPGTVTLLANDATGTSSFASGLNWSGGTVPSSTNNFIVSGLNLLTPADGLIHSFAGSSLTLSNGGALRIKTTSSGKAINVGTALNLDNGVVSDWATTSQELAGVVSLKAGGGTFDPQNVSSFTVSSWISGAGSLTLDSPNGTTGGTVILSGYNTYTGGTVLNASDTLQTRIAGALGSTNSAVTFSNTASHGYGTLDLYGYNLSLGNLTGGGGKILNNSTPNVLLTIGCGNATGGNFQGILADHSAGTGTLALNKVGTGTLQLSGANTYTGSTLVSAGTLDFSAGSGTSSSLQVENGAICRIETTSKVLAATAQVTLKTGSQLNLGVGVNHAIGILLLNGVIQPIGTFGSSSSSAANKNDAFLAGAGMLNVTNTLISPVLSANPGNAVVALNWTAVTGALSYNVKRSTTSGTGYTVIATGLTTTNYLDTNINNGGTYYYVVTSKNSVGESVNSSEVAATPIGAPAPPTGLAASASSGQVLLSWITPPGTLGCNIKTATTSGGPYTTITSLNGSGYTVTGLANGTLYWYVITATNSYGESLNSAEVSAKPGSTLVVLQSMDANNTVTTSFNSSGNWSDATLPSSAKDYLVPMRAVSGIYGGLRTPDAAASYTFAGGSLTLSNGGLRLRNNGTTTIGTSASTGLLVDGGVVSAWKQPTTLAGFITLKAGGGFFDAQTSASGFTISANIGGVGSFWAGSDSNAFGGPIVLTSANTYKGGTVLAGPAQIQLSGAGTLGATNSALTFKNSQEVPLANANAANLGFGLLDLNGTSQTVAGLNGAGGMIVNNNGGTSILSIGDATSSDFQGTIANRTSGAGLVALTKNGSGTNTFYGVNTYTGPTTIKDGTLRLGTPAAIAAPAPTCRWIADSLTVVNGGSVSTWTDSILGKPATQGTAGNQPKLYSTSVNTLNGHKVVRFTSSSSQYMTVAAANSLMNGAGDFTMVVVFKTSTTGAASSSFYQNTGLLGCEQGGATTDWAFCLNGSQLGGGLGAGNSDCNSDLAIYGGNVTDNKPHVGTYVRSGSTISLYVDGMKVATQASICTSARGSFDFQIGAMTAGAICFNGDMAEIQLFNRALSAIEVADDNQNLLLTYGGMNPASEVNLFPICQWSADDLTNSDGTAISTWTDNVSATNATQATSGNQPKVYSNVFNGHKAVRFASANNQYMTVASANSPISGAGSFSLVMVFKTSTLGNSSSLFYQNTGLLGCEQSGAVADWAFCLNGSQVGAGLGAGSSGCSSDLSLYGGYVTDGNPHVGMFVRSNDTVSIFVDGVKVISQSSLCTSVRGGYAFQIGAMTAGSQCFNGDVAKIQVFNRALNVAEVASLSQSLASTYGQGLLSDSTAVNLAGATAVLDLNNHVETIGSLAGVSGSTLALNGGSLTAGGNNTSTTFAGNFSGIGDFTKTGAGTMTLGGSQTFRSLKVGVGSNGGVLAISTDPANHLVVGNSNTVVNIGTNSGTGTLTIGNLDATSLIISSNNATAILIGATQSVGTLNLNGGTLTIKTTGSAIAGGEGTSTVNFNGTTLKPAASSTTFIQRLTTANLQAGGAIFDTFGYNLTVPQAFAGTGGLVKNGGGTLTLTGANTYTGDTVINAGTLALSGTGINSSSARICISNLAILSIGTLTLNSGQALTGSGSLYGSVNALAGSTVRPGDTLGTLTVLGNASLNGAVVLELNRTNLQTSDQLLCYGTVSGSGTVIVTNLGPALQAGDSFQLFSQPVTGLALAPLPTLTTALVWTNKLAIDGTIQVLSNASTVPTSLTMQYSGTSVLFGWPADHTGWRLQMQTNSLNTGLGTNWVEVANSSLTNQIQLSVDPVTGSTFFRLVYP